MLPICLLIVEDLSSRVAVFTSRLNPVKFGSSYTVRCRQWRYLAEVLPTDVPNKMSHCLETLSRLSMSCCY